MEHPSLYDKRVSSVASGPSRFQHRLQERTYRETDDFEPLAWSICADHSITSASLSSPPLPTPPHPPFHPFCYPLSSFMKPNSSRSYLLELTALGPYRVGNSDLNLITTDPNRVPIRSTEISCFLFVTTLCLFYSGEVAASRRPQVFPERDDANRDA